MSSYQSLENNYFPTLTTITVEEQDNNPDKQVFVETFLIDAISPPNKKGWRVSHDDPVDFDRRVLESKNHPLVLFQTKGSRGELVWDHPVAPITSMEAAADPVRANIEFQKKYTIGYARHFKKIKNGLWHATYEIVNDRAKRFFLAAKKKGLRLFTSPYIVRPSSEKDRQNIKNWALIHNAIVSTPANPEDLATIKEVCDGNNLEACRSLFASLTTPDSDIEDCGFCVEKSLYEYDNWVSSQFRNSYQLTNMTESASAGFSAQNVGTPTPSVETPVNTISNTSPQNPEIHQFIDKPNIDLSPSPDNSKLSSPQQDTTFTPPADEKEARIAELQKQLSDLSKKYETDQRRNTIEKLFAPIESLFVDQSSGELDEKSYNNEIKKYTNSNYTFDEIKEIVEAKYIKARETQRKQQYQSSKLEKASFDSSHVTESASYIPYTQMSTSLENTKVLKSRPFMKVLDSVFTAGGNY